MTTIEKIKAEIERRKKENMYVDLPMSIGRYYEDRDLLAFIDTLESEIPNDLEEAAEKHSTDYDSTIWFVLESPNQKTIWKKEHKETFIAGAKWGAEHLKK